MESSILITLSILSGISDSTSFLILLSKKGLNTNYYQFIKIIGNNKYIKKLY